MMSDFKKMKWWHKQGLTNAFCMTDKVAAKRWVARCDGPDDFYNNAPVKYLLVSIAYRDPTLGLSLAKAMVKRVAIRRKKIATRQRANLIESGSKSQLRAEFIKRKKEIRKEAKDRLEDAMIEVMGWGADKRSHVAILKIIGHLEKELDKAGRTLDQEFGALVRQRVSKKKWEDIVSTSNEGVINGD